MQNGQCRPFRRACFERTFQWRLSFDARFKFKMHGNNTGRVGWWFAAKFKIDTPSVCSIVTTDTADKHIIILTACQTLLDFSSGRIGRSVDIATAF